MLWLHNSKHSATYHAAFAAMSIFNDKLTTATYTQIDFELIFERKSRALKATNLFVSFVQNNCKINKKVKMNTGNY